MPRGPRGKLTLQRTGMTSTTASGKSRPLNFQEQIEQKARGFWGEDAVVEVEHEKSTGAHALGRTAPNGWTAVRVKVKATVDGKPFERATEVSLHYDRSQAYRGAIKQLEKLYERSLKEAL